MKYGKRYVLNGRWITIMKDTEYKIEHSFRYVHTGERLYRVKRIFQSGGIDYVVLNEGEMIKLMQGDRS